MTVILDALGVLGYIGAVVTIITAAIQLVSHRMTVSKGFGAGPWSRLDSFAEAYPCGVGPAMLGDSSLKLAAAPSERQHF